MLARRYKCQWACEKLLNIIGPQGNISENNNEIFSMCFTIGCLKFKKIILSVNKAFEQMVLSNIIGVRCYMIKITIKKCSQFL
jgi:hypothetical protein